MKKLISILILFLLVCSTFLIPVVISENIALWPAKLNIGISRYPNEEIKFNKIQVKNPYDEKITVVPQVINPSEDVRNESYDLIPDLSWVKVSPEELIISPKSSGFFELTVNVPEEVRSEYYGEKWEVWARVYKKINPDSKGVIINIMPTTKVFISTPVDESNVDLNPFVFWFTFIGLVVLISIYFSIRFLKARNKKSVFYFRKKKD